MNDTPPALHTVFPEANSKKLSTTIGYYIAFIGLGLVTASLGPTLPGLAENTHSLLSEIGFLFATRSIGYFAGAILSGRLMDRFPGHPIVAGMLIVMALLVASVPFFSVLWLLSLVLLLIGLTEGIVDVGCNTTIVWLHGRKIGPYMNGLHFFFGVGAFLAPVIVAQTIIFSGSTLTAYWIIALLVFPTAFWLLFLPSPASAARQTQQVLKNRHPWLLFLIALLLFLYAGLEVGFGGWVFTFAREMEIANPAQAAYLTSVFWGAFTAGRLLGIPIAFRFKPMLILLIDYLGAVLSIGIIWIWIDSFVVVLIGSAIFGLTIASIFPTALSLAERNMRITGKVTSCFFMGSSIGNMTIPWMMGQVFAVVGPQAIIYSIFICLFLSFFVFGALRFYTSKIS